jgi:hypothetical protein
MRSILFILIVLMPVTTIYGQWHGLLEPYMMFPNMNGNIGLGSLPATNIDENPSDIFSHFQVGAMVYGEAYNDKWVISSDLTYMSLGQDVASTNVILLGHAGVKQWGWELAALRRLKPWLSAGIAGQLNSIKSDLDLTINEATGPAPRSNSFSKTWVDPSFVVAMKLPLAGKWDLRARGNIGGFGIGSKIYWQLQAYVDYHIARLFQLSAGYRAIKADYEKGSGSDYFLYNMTTFGPVLRFGFNF